MVAAWENMDNEPDSTKAPSHKASTNEEIVSKNSSAIVNEKERADVQNSNLVQDGLEG